MTRIQPMGAQRPRLHAELKRGFAASASVLALSLLAQPVMAQTAPEVLAQTASEDTIVVTGTRQIIQDAIALKRKATTVVDGLSADEIGDLPALSIGEALEQIASVGAQREGSGATEVSIRGLGPFLGSTVINGREATNGSGDRSVNFSQFPSELFNKLEVYKTQEASFIEGGVAGQISLSTLKPLDYGKRRIQFQAKGTIGEDNLDIEDAEIDVGYRLTGSYVDQWEGAFGDFGISIGGQLRRQANPEQEARSSSTFDACVISGFDGSSCDGSSPNEEGQDINPETGLRFGLTEPFVLTTSSRSFRQNITDDSRDSIFASAQWEPNDRLEVNADVQYADRVFTENRSDLIIDSNDFEEAVTGESLPIAGFDLTTTSTGALRTGTTSGDVQSISQFSERLEEYIGFGGNIGYQFNEKLHVSVDGSYSDTSRRENQFQTRIASPAQLAGIEVLQNGTEAHQFTLLDFDVTDVSQFINDNIEVREDLNQFRNHEIWAVKGDAVYEINKGFFSNFKAGARFSSQTYDALPRVRNEVEVDDNDQFITGFGGSAVRSTIELDISTGAEGDLANALGLPGLLAAGLPDGFVPQVLDGQLTQGLIPVVIGGETQFVPFSQDSNGDFDVTATGEQFAALGFGASGDTDTPNEGFATLDDATIASCALSSSQSNFLDGEVNGNLFTNIDSNGDIIENGTGNTFIGFDATCLTEAVLGREVSIPSASDAGSAELFQSVDVEEETIALYGQFDFETEFKDLPVRGNVGIRYIDTSVRSDGFRTNLIADLDPDTGELIGVTADDDVLESVSFESSYSELLPSLNLVVDVRDDVLLRGAVFRAISRPDPADLGAGRTITTQGSSELDLTLDDLVDGIRASGNPALQPFTSWNYDAAVEWYPNEDSIFALGFYYKRFDGGFQTQLQEETINVNGEDITRFVENSAISDDTSEIFGFETSIAHAFTYLPGIWGGLGFNVSYNYADSDFEVEAGRLGTATTLDENGEVLEQLEGFIDPVGLPGLSKHTANGRVYLDAGKANFTLIGKYRSDFFQPGLTTPQELRVIDDALVFDGRISYKLNNNIKISLEATNITNEARTHLNPTSDSFAEINVFGRRYFAGVTAKF